MDDDDQREGAVVIPFQRRGARTRVTVPPRSAEAWSDRAMADRTREAYDSQVRKYLWWCRQLSGYKPWNGSGDTLADYATWLANENYSPDTIGQSIAAVRDRHVRMGVEPPDGRAAGKVLSGYRKTLLAAGWRPKQAAALSPEQVCQLVDACDLSTAAGLRDRAMFLCAFELGLRRTELVAVSVEHLTWTATGVRVLIPKSKTDQEGQGTTRPITAGTPGPGRHDAVAALREWRAYLVDNGADPNEGPVFRAVDRHGTVAGLGRWAGITRVRLDGEGFGRAVRRAAARAGLPDDLTPHLFRRSAATAAYRATRDTLAVGRHLRYADGSTVLNRYIEPDHSDQANPMAGVTTGGEGGE